MATTIAVTDPSNRSLLDYDGTSGAILRWYAFGLGLNDVLSQTNVAPGTRTTFVPTVERTWSKLAYFSHITIPRLRCQRGLVGGSVPRMLRSMQ